MFRFLSTVHLKGLLSRRDLASTIGMSAGVLGARLGGAFANFAFALILARYLSPAEVGAVFMLIAMAMLASLGATLNIETGAVRHLLQPVARGELAWAAGYVVTAKHIFFKTTPLVFIAFVLVVAFFSHLRGTLTEQMGWAIFFAALSIPLFSILRLGSLFGHAMSKVVASGISWGLVRPFLLMLFVYVVVTIVPEARIDYVLMASFAACIGALCVQAFLLRGILSPLKDITPDRSLKKEWVKTGLLLSVTILLFEYFQNVVIVAAGFGLSEADVARLGIAIRFVGFLRMGVMAVNSAIAPKISHAVGHKDMAEAGRLLRLSNHLKVWPTIAVTILVWALAPWLVGLFGREYASASWALRLFALMPLATAIFGPSALMLNIVGHQRDIFIISTIALALMIILTPLAGFYGGINGAAAAPVLIMMVWEVMLWWKTKRLTGLDGSVLGLFKR